MLSRGEAALSLALLHDIVICPWQLGMTFWSERSDLDAAQRLFVVTRDISADRSAAHALRLALGFQRRRQRVVVFLTDGAIGSVIASAGIDAIEKLLSAGARVLVDESLFGRMPPVAGGRPIEKANDDDLATLLLDAEIHAQWC